MVIASQKTLLCENILLWPKWDSGMGIQNCALTSSCLELVVFSCTASQELYWEGSYLAVFDLVHLNLQPLLA